MKTQTEQYEREQRRDDWRMRLSDFGEWMWNLGIPILLFLAAAVAWLGSRGCFEALE